MIIGISKDTILAIEYILVGIVVMGSVLKLVHDGILLPENSEKSNATDLTLTDIICISVYWVFLAVIIVSQIGVFVTLNAIMPVTLIASVILMLDLAFYHCIDRRLDPDKPWDSFTKDVLRVVVPVATALFILVDGFSIIFIGE